MTAATRRRVSRHERAEQLLDVALALIAERGYGAVSVAAIAEGAGITKPTLYKVYPGLHPLLLALFLREQKRIDLVLDRIVPRDPGGRLPAGVLVDSLTGILHAVAEAPLTWRLALFPIESSPAALKAVVQRRRENLVKRARTLVEWGVEYLDADEEPDEEVLARMLLSWAEEYARMVLEDATVEPERLVRTAELTLQAVAWRAAPLPWPRSLL